MTAFSDLLFEPLLPLWLMTTVAAAFAFGLTLAAVRSRRLAWPRALAAIAMLAVLANPVQRSERRAERPDIALAVVDRTASMTIGNRARIVDEALASLRSRSPGVEWRIVTAGQSPGKATRMGAVIDGAAGEVPPDRLAAVVALTDGISADAPDVRLLPRHVPFHVLIAGDPRLSDRRLIVERVPSYSVAGQSAEVTIRIDDGGNARGKALLAQEISGSRETTREVDVGVPVTMQVPVTRRGTIEVALSVSPSPAGEATLVNNRALVRLNGVTDRLRVLLVSGVPYPGGRVWRDILKSDANVDLVHFTILRLPASFDTTPPEQMSLIPFPVEELFEKHLPEFDLIIFDRFGLSELLSPIYFQDLGDRVRNGGGLLVVTGDEFAAPGGLAETPLARLLPARTAGPAIDIPFRPALSDVGRRHPVTSALVDAWGGADWGRWGSQSDLAATSGQVLMQGAGGRPLLILDHAGKGRVGLIASTNVWWWSRAVDGGGPQAELLRRTAHWLMREPDLDENQLEVRARGRTLDIAARGVAPPAFATLLDPANRPTEVRLSPTLDGATSADVKVAANGLYRIEAGGLTRFALAGDSAEFSEVRPRANPLAKAARASGGGTYWLHGRLPDIRRVQSGRATSGPGWLGLVENRSGAIVAVERRALIQPVLALLLIAGTLMLAWWRERR